MNPLRRSRRRGQTGQSLVEFALVLPILLLMLTGTIDLGRILFTYIALEDAAQEGAIYGAHESVPESNITARVRSSSNHAEVTGATVAIACSVTPSPGTIAVTTSYQLPLITPVISSILGGTVELRATFIGTNFKERCA